MSKAERERSARERLAEERKREAQRAKKLRALLVSGGALLVIAVVVVAVVLVQSGGDDDKGEPAVATAPLSRQADGSIVMAKPGVTGPVLEIFEDFQCPACEKFEEASGKTVKELAAEGKVKVIYRPFSLFFQGQEPTRGNSIRALNASLCAPADKWVAYHDRLFEEQGPETSQGFGNGDLVTWGEEVGITGDAFDSCVRDGQKNAEIPKANAAAQKAGVESTPWVTLNGQKLDQNITFVPGALRKAVESAPPAAPSTTPSASASSG
ncbi:DsbA family protein [Thermomonospora umbrina]|uniref:Protein-disulfide isomerase n=1 Tax=Thermomonospora umbrina TaxID=111806 RepID=A0A3D9SVD7_9ACTN|nr:thioredoxin domain-containing protein [Thermomonospora umbrina]REE99758.1 protein-disulfide isomerase [Thermomonospora umbrina]